MSYVRKKELINLFVERAKGVFGPIKRKVLAQGPERKKEPVKSFRAGSETTSRPKGEQKPGQPKLGGTVKDDVNFLMG
jgi:hypothetical protein